MPVELRPVTPADFPRMVEIMRDQLPDPPTVDQMLKEEDMATKTPGIFISRIGAVDPTTGLLVGYGVITRGPTTPKGNYEINVRVDRPFRRQGVGTALYAAIDRIASQQQATKLKATAREADPADLVWAQRRGFIQKQHLFESTLDLASFDRTPYAEAIHTAEASGIHFTSFAEYPQDDPGLQRFLDFCWELMADVPGFEGTKPTVELWKQGIAADPEFWEPAAIILAVEQDRWAAMAWMQKRPNGSYYHSLTAVHRDYRGRGLALAVKLKALEYVSDKGVPYVRTHNDSNNHRMLAVNRKMGYKPEPGVFALERTL